MYVPDEGVPEQLLTHKAAFRSTAPAQSFLFPTLSRSYIRKGQYDDRAQALLKEIPMFQDFALSSNALACALLTVFATLSRIVNHRRS